MLQTIEVEIGADGRIRPLESLPELPAGRALLTLLDAPIPAILPVNSRNIDFQDLFGLLKAERTVGADEMNAAIGEHAKKKFRDRD